jgi:hypothetical protein
MSDQPNPRPEDGTVSVIIAFVVVMAATIAVLYASGTIYIPGYH